MIKDFNITPSNKAFLIDKINRLDPTEQWVCNVRKRKQQRSSPQNERMWQFFSDLAEYLGYERKEHEFVKEFVTLDAWPEIVTLPTGEIQKLPPRTSRMDIKEHREMMDAVERRCAEWGFVWDNAHNFE